MRQLRPNPDKRELPSQEAGYLMTFSKSQLVSWTILLAMSLGSPSLAQQPESPLVASYKTFLAKRSSSQYGVTWQSIGPVVNSARVEAVQLDPSRPGTMYVAFGSGGLWKTKNNGISWRPIFENQPTYGIGDIALAPSNPNIIYLGTGESLKKARNFTIPGNGVYRSLDGGENWQHLGLNDSWHIGEIAVHPRDPDTVLVAVLGHFWSRNKNRGLYLTNDGGKTWKPVIQIDDQTGANDVVWSTSNPKVAYASLWQNHPGVAGKNSSIYRSADRGLTWQKCEKGLPQGDQTGRIGLAVSNSDSDKVYALIDNRKYSETAAAQIYRSVDGGRNWQRTHRADQKFLSRIGWYFADIYVNPQDDEEVYALGVRLAHSTDGGKTFNYLAGQVSHVNPSAATGLHLDQCELWIHPTNPEHLVVGNDGGLYQSFDRGKHWRHFNNLPTGEFYDIEVDQRTPPRIFAGAQDDATVYGPTTEFNSNTHVDQWKYLWIDPWNGGDGCVTLIDPDDPQTVYYSAQEGAFRRKDMKTNRSVSIRPRANKLLKEVKGERFEFNFVAPMSLSPHDSKTLFLGGNFIFKSHNRGDDWKIISPNLCDSQIDQRKSTAVSCLVESPRTPGLLFAGTDKGAFWVSENHGQQWANRSSQLPTGYIRSIVPSRFADRVYLTVSGLNEDHFDSYVYVSNDRGLNWNLLSKDLPAEPANVIVEDPEFEQVLYLGTFRGVYFSRNRGKSWSLLGSHLPVCSVADLAIHEKSRVLFAGTHGRGIYKLDLNPVHEILRSRNKSTDNWLIKIPTADRPVTHDTRPSLNFREPRKTSISFWLGQANKVKLSVYEKKPDASKINDRQQKPIISFPIAGRAGLNQFRWNLQTKSTASAEPYFVRYKSFLSAGNYWIKIDIPGSKPIGGALTVKNRFHQ